MTAYVEASFILELALQQEGATSAEAALRLGERGRLHLTLPAFPLAEPFSTLAFRRVERQRLHDSLQELLSQLRRSKAHDQFVAAMQGVLEGSAQVSEQEAEGLRTTAQRVLKVARLIELDAPAFEQAIEYGSVYGLDPKDAIIYAAVVADLRRQPTEERKCFLSRDREALDYPSIRSELEEHGCRYVDSFGAGLEYLRSCLD